MSGNEAELLRRLWAANLRVLLAKMESEPETVSAAELTACSKFLDASGVNRMTLDALDHASQMAAALRGLDLPTFDD